MQSPCYGVRLLLESTPRNEDLKVYSAAARFYTAKKHLSNPYYSNDNSCEHSLDTWTPFLRLWLLTSA
jgi:hypothetical protein